MQTNMTNDDIVQFIEHNHFACEALQFDAAQTNLTGLEVDKAVNALRECSSALEVVRSLYAQRRIADQAQGLFGPAIIQTQGERS